MSILRKSQVAPPTAAVEDPLRQPAHDGEPLVVYIEQSQLVDGELVLACGQTVNQLRGVCAATADHRNLHTHRLALQHAEVPFKWRTQSPVGNIQASLSPHSDKKQQEICSFLPIVTGCRHPRPIAVSTTTVG